MLLASGFWQLKTLPKASLRFRIRGMRKPQSPEEKGFANSQQPVAKVITMKKVEVKNFKLYTTAVISIEWKQELLNVNLDLAMMLKMMHMEGLTEADIERYSQNGQPIPFKKVTLLLFQDDGKPGQYYTDESFDEEDDPTVFYVEIKE